MDIAKHEVLFSKMRMNRYIQACGSDKIKAVQLYKFNIQASQALYPVISVFEIALRNALDREMSKFFHDPQWLITRRNAFANHAGLTRKDAGGHVIPDLFFMEKLRRTEDKLRFRKAAINQGNLLSELTFGFWVKFFDSNSIKILNGIPLQAFINKPHMKLSVVHSHLNGIVTLRNRIAHHEPICFDRTGKLCLQTMERYEADLLLALHWIDTDLKKWSERINFFRPVYKRICTL